MKDIKNARIFIMDDNSSTISSYRGKYIIEELNEGLSGRGLESDR